MNDAALNVFREFSVAEYLFRVTSWNFWRVLANPVADIG
jgi:hypothetical protein